MINNKDLLRADTNSWYINNMNKNFTSKKRYSFKRIK